MSLGNTTETEILSFIFDDTDPAWINATDFYLALHTSDPGEGGNQTTNEAAYTSYARVAVSRTSGFTVSGNTAQNAGQIQFPECTGSTSTATHFSIGTASTSTGQIIAKGALSASLSISNGIQPQFNAGSLTFTVD